MGRNGRKERGRRDEGRKRKVRGCEVEERQKKRGGI